LHEHHRGIDQKVRRSVLSFSRKLSQFWCRVSIVLAGTAAAQAIPLAILPLLTRMLPPEALGQYFIWLGVVTVASVVATLRLDVAIFNAKTAEEMAALLQAAITSAVVVAGFLLTVLLVLQFVAPGWIERHVVNNGVSAAACMAALLAISQTCIAAYVCSAKFTRQAFARILLAGGTALAQVSAVVAGFGVKGMIYGQVLATACVAIWLVLDVRRSLSLDFGGSSVSRCLSTLREHWRFPVFSMPADFISSFSAQLPLFLIGGRFGSAPVGQYSLTNRALAAPVGLLAGSVLSVFKEEASRQFRETGQCRQAYTRTFYTLALLGIVPFVLIYFVSEKLFVLVFGPEWAEAGRLAALLAPMFYLKFVASPLSYTMYLANRQSHDLLWQVVLLAMTAFIFNFSRDIHRAVASYSAGYSALYLVYLLMSYRSANGVNR